MMPKKKKQATITTKPLTSSQLLNLVLGKSSDDNPPLVRVRKVPTLEDVVLENENLEVEIAMLQAENERLQNTVDWLRKKVRLLQDRIDALTDEQ